MNEVADVQGADLDLLLGQLAGLDVEHPPDEVLVRADGVALELGGGDHPGAVGEVRQARLP